MHAAYAACVRLRAALRVLHLLSVQYMEPHGEGYKELYGAIRRAAPWHEMVHPGMTVGVELRLRSCSDWNHSTAAQQCVQAAIADAVRDAGCAASRAANCIDHAARAHSPLAPGTPLYPHEPHKAAAYRCELHASPCTPLRCAGVLCNGGTMFAVSAWPPGPPRSMHRPPATLHPLPPHTAPSHGCL